MTIPMDEFMDSEATITIPIAGDEYNEDRGTDVHREVPNGCAICLCALMRRITSLRQTPPAITSSPRLHRGLVQKAVARLCNGSDDRKRGQVWCSYVG
jgi:hypothetical protein